MIGWIISGLTINLSLSVDLFIYVRPIMYAYCTIEVYAVDKWIMLIVPSGVNNNI
jgi:hypothetical protein